MFFLVVTNFKYRYVYPLFIIVELVNVLHRSILIAYMIWRNDLLKRSLISSYQRFDSSLKFNNAKLSSTRSSQPTGTKNSHSPNDRNDRDHWVAFAAASLSAVHRPGRNSRSHHWRKYGVYAIVYMRSLFHNTNYLPGYPSTDIYWRLPQEDVCVWMNMVNSHDHHQETINQI